MIHKHALWSVRALPKLCEQWKICQEKRKILSNKKQDRGEEICICLSKKKKRETAVVRYELKTESRKQISEKEVRHHLRYMNNWSPIVNTKQITHSDVPSQRSSALWCALYTTKFIFSLRQTIFSVFPPSMSCQGMKNKFFKETDKTSFIRMTCFMKTYTVCHLAWICAMIPELHMLFTICQAEKV